MNAAPRRGPGRYLVGGGVLVVLAVIVIGAITFSSAKATLTADHVALARVGMPMGGGTIQSVSVVTGPHANAVPVSVRDGQITPTKPVPAGSKLSVQVVVKRPGWISWLAGSSQRLNLTVTAPAAKLRSHFVTVAKGAALRLHFQSPVTSYAYGASSSQLHQASLSAPATEITIPHSGLAGSEYVSAAPRSWESAKASVVSWFPGGGSATAVANPAPGSQISASTPVTLTFSKPVSAVLGSHLPPVSPANAGSWQTLNSHTIVFKPTGYGYGLGAKVQIPLPNGVHLAGGTQNASSSTGIWTVPAGSTTRLQQLLAITGYLPMNFKYANSTGVGLTMQAQEAAAVHAPAGSFSPRWSNIPSWVTGSWQTGSYGELTKAAVMAFENANGLAADGSAGPQVWRALINAALKGQHNTFGYTVVDVSEGSPETLNLWHDGRTVLTADVNTGIAQAPTAQGTFAVYEHLRVTTMSGHNPDGSTYHDTGIPFVSYFNGGDALHGFIRGSYGTPQSLGCVEMPFATAGAVYPYTPIGTIVHIT